ncbi:hypothetical protein Cyrtocomes_00142 [Candidatus Cyrtobacter comes]|uniref:Uncharacterized protein n=1 Tax=Candidatus Cyrtobacter comes TaxID=675776 RepID=A0ABU5L7K2_9RICK|nr:hypothetical protein [Candidatus Cyrtobacter comes]
MIKVISIANTAIISALKILKRDRVVLITIVNSDF